MTLALSALPTVAREKFETSDLPRILETPLIMGASISADLPTTSPGKRLALRYTKPDKIKTHAFGGRTGRDVLASLPDSAFDGKSAVLAMDLFFWDSARGIPASSLAALDKLMRIVEKRKIPIVLGEIPELLPGYQPHHAKLNQAIRRACDGYAKCFLMPFIDLHRQLLRDEALEIGGKRVGVMDLVPDGLHLATPASEYLADLMRDVILGQKPAFKR